MYSTDEIALFLGVARSNINYYIRNGYLKATKNKNLRYRVAEQDYRDFRDDYFDSNKRFAKRGPSKKLTEYDIIGIDNMLQDAQDNKISVNEFKNKYKNDFDLLAIYDSLLEYKISKHSATKLLLT